MLDSKKNSGNYRTLQISIGAIIKDVETLGFVHDHLKSEKMSKHAVKKLPFVKKYVLDQYFWFLRQKRCLIKL